MNIINDKVIMLTSGFRCIRGHIAIIEEIKSNYINLKYQILTKNLQMTYVATNFVNKRIESIKLPSMFKSNHVTSPIKN